MGVHTYMSVVGCCGCRYVHECSGGVVGVHTYMSVMGFCGCRYIPGCGGGFAGVDMYECGGVLWVYICT